MSHDRSQKGLHKLPTNVIHTVHSPRHNRPNGMPFTQAELTARMRDESGITFARGLALLEEIPLAEPTRITEGKYDGQYGLPLVLGEWPPNTTQNDFQRVNEALKAAYKACKTDRAPLPQLTLIPHMKGTYLDGATLVLRNTTDEASANHAFSRLQAQLGEFKESLAEILHQNDFHPRLSRDASRPYRQ